LFVQVLMIPGGLWEDAMTPYRFWVVSGLADGLARRGHVPVLIERPIRPCSWAEEVPRVLAALDRPSVLFAGSNGCSVAALAAIAEPVLVKHVIFGWPATAGDLEADARTRAELAAVGATEATSERLLNGQTLRGVADRELVALPMPISVLPSRPTNTRHQQLTVDRLVELGASELRGCPEPPLPDFAPFLADVVHDVAKIIDAAGADR